MIGPVVYERRRFPSLRQLRRAIRICTATETRHL